MLLIIFSMLFVSVVTDDKDSLDFGRYPDGILLVLFVSKHCLKM